MKVEELIDKYLNEVSNSFMRDVNKIASLNKGTVTVAKNNFVVVTFPNEDLAAGFAGDLDFGGTVNWTWEQLSSTEIKVWDM